MTATTGGQYGGGTNNPCNTSAGNGLGDCTPGGGTGGGQPNYGTAPGSTPPPTTQTPPPASGPTYKNGTPVSDCMSGSGAYLAAIGCPGG